MAIEVILDEASAATLRATGFQATKGGNGVGLPQDLRVRALDVPGSSVRILRGPSGSAALVSRAGSESGQSYITVASEAAELVAVPATDSSGGKTRYIIQYVDKLNAPGAYHACVDDLAPYALIPHTVLASITQPASTATIQPSMITDLREVANPGSWPAQRAYAMSGSEIDTLNSTATYPGGETFPGVVDTAWAELTIPARATLVHVTMMWAGLDVPAGTSRGYLFTQIGMNTNPDKVITQGTRYEETGPGRRTLISADDVPIPEALRGTKQKFYPRGNVTSGDVFLGMNAGSSVTLQVQFVEEAD